MMDKWRYCVLLSEEKLVQLLPSRVIYYLNSSAPGGFSKKVVGKLKYGGEIGRLEIDAPAIAYLGDQGWELVHVSQEGSLYFKRRTDAQ